VQLQRQLDEFRAHYNEQRPHRALDRRTPGDAYRATPKALPASNGHAQGHYRLRYDRLDDTGKMSLRRAGRMHHLGVGSKHARKRVLALADDHRITVTASPPARSSRRTSSSLRRPTGATKTTSPADGRAPKTRHMSRDT
jgi:hypothetical protein